jgi:hypothetical protein
MQTVNDERHLLSGDLTGRSSVGPDRRRGLAREAAALKAQAKQIEQDAIREAAALRTSAASQAEELHASAAGAVERLEIEVGQAMTDLTAAMASLGGALGKVRGEIEERPAAAHKATRKAPAVKSTAAPKRRPTRATTTGPTPEPVTPAAAVGPVTVPEPIAPAATVEPVVAAEPIAPAAVARPAIPQPTRTVPVVANAVRSAEFKPKLAKPADSGFVRLTPPPGVPARRVVPASVPPAAVAAARRIRRTVTAASATAVPEPMTVAQVPGGPSCLATATSGTAAVTVLRIRT